MKRNVLLAVALGIMFAAEAGARIIAIPSDYATIQAGINAADLDDTVLVTPGIYDDNLVFPTHRIVLASHFIISHDEQTIAGTIIDGGARNRVISINGPENDNSVVEGFTIQNGRTSNSGGGILCQSSNPLIRNNIITMNTSIGDGGGIYAVNGSPSIHNNIISYNRSSQLNGGGIGCYYSNAEIKNNVIIGNRAFK